MVSPANERDLVTELASSLGVRPLPPFRRASVPTASTRHVSALLWGEGSPAVSYLHGAGLNAHTWDTTILASGLPSLALDLPGHGDSSWREDADYSPRAIADDVADAIARLTEMPQLLVGHSLGGLTAAIIAAERPDLVRELVILDITPGIDQSAGPAALREFFAVTDFPSREAVVERAIAFGLGGDRQSTERGVFFNTRIRDDGKVEWKHHFARLAASATSPSRTDALLSDELWRSIERLTVPTTLVRAEHGFVTEQDAEAFRRHLPSARILESDASHNIQETRPHELATVLRTLAATAPEWKGQQ